MTDELIWLEVATTVNYQTMVIGRLISVICTADRQIKANRSMIIWYILRSLLSCR